MDFFIRKGNFQGLTCSRNEFFNCGQKFFVMGNICLSETKLISSGTKNILSEQKAQAYARKEAK